MNVFSHDTWLLGLLTLPLLAGVAVALGRGRSGRLGRLIEAPLQGRMVRARRPGVLGRRAVLTLAALGALVLAMGRPLGGEVTSEFTRSGRDVIFVVDVSRSMLAQDVAPNRLERAKQIVRDGLGALRGDRVAVVAFAGTAVVKCPLTLDTAFARLVVDDLSPESVARGGSHVGDALREVMDTLIPDQDEGRHRDVVLISDGGDEDSFPVEAAAALAAHQTRLITVGLGSTAGATVPDRRGEPTVYHGETVISALNSTTLETMARATPGGVFLPVGDGYIEFDTVYRGLARAADRQELSSAVSTRRAELFQWPLGLAVLLLVIERMLNDRR